MLKCFVFRICSIIKYLKKLMTIFLIGSSFLIFEHKLGKYPRKHTVQ